MRGATSKGAEPCSRAAAALTPAWWLDGPAPEQPPGAAKEELRAEALTLAQADGHRHAAAKGALACAEAQADGHRHAAAKGALACAEAQADGHRHAAAKGALACAEAQADGHRH